MSKAAEFAKLRRAREGGGHKWKPAEETELYDEVTEDQYKRIVKGRLQRDDFVVDDGIDGYADNGMDDWEAADGADGGESEEDDRYARKKSKVSTKKKVSKPTKKAPPPPPVPDISAYRPVVSAAKEQNFMNDLLLSMDTVPITAPKARKRKPSPEYDPSSSSPASGSAFSTFRNPVASSEFPSSDPPEENTFPSSEDFSPAKKVKATNGKAVGVTPATNRLTKLEFDTPGEEDVSFDDMTFDTDDAYMEMDLDPVPTSGPKKEEQDIKLDVQVPDQKLKLMVKNENEKKEDALPSWLSVHATLAVTDDSLGSLGGNRSSSSSNISALEKDGSFRFYWIDYLELEGKVYFVGKVIDKRTNSYVSCCVTVEGLERNLYVLPREQRQDGGQDTGITPTEDDVYDDFDKIRRKVGVSSWAAKWVKRKYAFGEDGVPNGESDWMKVVYGFNEPQIPMDVSSPNFAKVFGTNTSAFELLVLKRKIMGPCWLEIKDPEVVNKGVSWCKLEVTVSNPKDINPFPESDATAPKDIPPLTVMSLSVRTIVNHQENKREVVCVTARTWANTLIDDPKPPSELPCTVHTFIRPLNNFPVGFEAKAKENKGSKIMPMKNERMLLNQLLVTMYKVDPDVIVGHEFLGVSLDVLLHRMRELKPEHWSRVGRFRRSKWPLVGKQGTNLKFLSGRLLCDLASDGAKSMITSTTWSLTEMCATHLKVERQDIDPDDTIKYLDGSLSSHMEMLTFVQHCETDAYFQMAIASKVQMLPLTKQLTGLAGNSWNKTLNGGRAERNEYILLHEFHRLKYVCPDKTWGKKSVAVAKATAEDGDNAVATTTKGKKDKYKGGLVFDPKKGLWDKYILVMDFNSLYPSIIQEYNIDFTTVERVPDVNGEEQYSEPPPSDVPQGVLPRLIATLVSRRRQVKSLMKDRSITPAKLLQYDIKQMALKLTANSMYGCLGFEYSRFYARPLAALTTLKGREILMHTKELAESLRLDVVYGDTDSVFVNSNVTDLAEAMKTAHEFKKKVNDNYKLLEIDLDSVFQRLLLLQKKKYAAVKVEDGGKTSTEIKGLDMKRREYCRLSKTVSQYVLDQILSGEETEVVVEKIHEYLTTIGENVRSGKMDTDEFIVFKRLGKNPEDYPDGKSQPHVQVALRLKTKGQSARAGDVIPYVFCLGGNGESAKTAQADKAQHPDEVRRVGSELKIDFEHYLANQVLPPIERLCEPIEGTERSRLAECLGLDPARFRSYGGEFEERVWGTLDSQMPDKERFKDSAAFVVTCPHCEGTIDFDPIYDRERSIVTSAGAICRACSKRFVTSQLQVQLELQIRQHVSKYYEGWTKCDDPTCGNQTRMMSVYGRRCMKPVCRGSVAFEYSDLKLYNQLLYYGSLFNAEKIVKGAKGAAKHDEVVALVDVNGEFLHAMTTTVEKYLNQCGWRWVELGGLFSFMKV